MSTYRERREAWVERLEGWADKQEAKAEAAYNGARQLADMIPLGQSILVGHHSEGRARRDADRIRRGMDAAGKHAAKAREMRAKAGNIAAAADAAIYSDDADAAERLRAKLDQLEAERARLKAYNVSARKGAPDPSLLDDAQRVELALHQVHNAWQMKGGAFPAYVLSNLSGRISATRKRLAELRS